ncbi:MAG: 50S ribosomal protein L25 [Janthinobacterium lividum]
MNITATKRGPQTKGELKKRIRQGFIPGSVYGKGLEPVNVEVAAKSIAGILTAETGLNTIIDLTVTGDAKTHSVLVDRLERNPITRNFIAIGFHQVKKGDKVTAQIPIVLIGEPEDVRLSDALLEHTMEMITVHAEPGDLPAHLDVDVSSMKVGDVLRVSDLPHNSKLEFTTPEDTAIAAVHYSRTAQAVEEADEAVPVSALTGEDAVVELRSDADVSSDTITGV